MLKRCARIVKGVDRHRPMTVICGQPYFSAWKDDAEIDRFATIADPFSSCDLIGLNPGNNGKPEFGALGLVVSLSARSIRQDIGSAYRIHVLR